MKLFRALIDKVDWLHLGKIGIYIIPVAIILAIAQSIFNYPWWINPIIGFPIGFIIGGLIGKSKL